MSVKVSIIANINHSIFMILQVQKRQQLEPDKAKLSKRPIRYVVTVRAKTL